jgi:hypothetical protein
LTRRTQHETPRPRHTGDLRHSRPVAIVGLARACNRPSFAHTTIQGPRSRHRARAFFFCARGRGLPCVASSSSIFSCARPRVSLSPGRSPTASCFGGPRPPPRPLAAGPIVGGVGTRDTSTRDTRARATTSTTTRARDRLGDVDHDRAHDRMGTRGRHEPRAHGRLRPPRARDTHAITWDTGTDLSCTACHGPPWPRDQGAPLDRSARPLPRHA